MVSNQYIGHLKKYQYLMSITVHIRILALVLASSWNHGQAADLCFPNEHLSELRRISATGFGLENSPADLYSDGQFSLYLQLFGSQIHNDYESLLRLLSSIYMFRQVCPGAAIPQLLDNGRYAELIEIFDSDTLHNAETDMRLEAWMDRYHISDGEVVEQLLQSVGALPALSRISHVHLLLQNKPLAAQLFQTAFDASGKSVSVVSTKLDSVAQLLDDGIADLVIADYPVETSESSASRLALLGHFPGAQWAMNYSAELRDLLDELLKKESKLFLYSFNSPYTNEIEQIVKLHPEIQLIVFDSFRDAQVYLSTRVCNRDKIDCQSPLSSHATLIVGSRQQTVYVNTFLQTAQRDVNQRIYITSMSTWDGVSAVDAQDLRNTIIYDSPRLHQVTNSFSRRDRTKALVLDIAKFTELQSVGMKFRKVPFIGFSGIYQVESGAIKRRLTFVPFPKFYSAG